jgi:carbonic anhydrase
VASLEYAILELGVKVIMVMGHTSCGAVKAACSGKAFPG